MFAKTLRLSLRHSPNFFRNARRSRGNGWQIYSLPHPIGETPSQAAVIVSKSTEPLATKRNTAKRQLRALLTPLLAGSQGQQIVIQLFSNKVAEFWPTLELRLKTIL